MMRSETFLLVCRGNSVLGNMAMFNDEFSLRTLYLSEPLPWLSSKLHQAIKKWLPVAAVIYCIGILVS